jgi:hypothetical protein
MPLWRGGACLGIYGSTGCDPGSGIPGRLLFHGATDIDNIVGDDAEPDPTVHSDVAAAANTRLEPYQSTCLSRYNAGP